MLMFQFSKMVRPLVLATVIGSFLIGSLNAADAKKSYNAEDVEKLIKDLSNWGRWGADDEKGALNLITPEKRKAAARLGKEGITVPLAHDIQTQRTADNPKPYEQTMLMWGKGTTNQWCVDMLSVSYHGFAHSHLDALCHIFHNGKMYNGFSREEVTQQGAKKLGIGNAKNGIFTRGVLIDIPRLKGLPYLEPGTAIYPEDLDAWEKKTGVKVKSGDVVLIRTGRWARRAKLGPWSVGGKGAAGLHVSCAKWLRERDLAVLGSDGASDVLPSQVEGVSHPVHILMLHSMGVHILDCLDLEALGDKAEELDRWEFLLTVAPIPVIGGTGSPLNPLATF